jgi:NAD(P)H-dependent FMN reductase
MSKSPKVLAFAGSARTGSYNKKLVKNAAAGATAAGADVTFIDLRDLPMPVYDADLEAGEGPPENAKKFKKMMIEADGFLISSPENNSTMSALLKNVIDWASRREEGEPSLTAFAGKYAGIMAASPGALGGIRGLPQLRLLLENIRVTVIPEQKALGKANEAFDENDRLIDAKARESVEAIGAKLAQLLAKLQA